MVEFIAKWTDGLSDEEKRGIVDLFNSVFDKDRTVSEFENQYLKNVRGRSFHVLMKDGDAIVGHNAGIPALYRIRGREVMAMCNVDTMIHPSCRGLENYYELMKTSFDRYAGEGFDFVYGFPNDNAYPLVKALKLMREVGQLDTYCLPVRIGAVKPALRWLDWASSLFCRGWVLLCQAFSSKQVVSFRIEKDLPSYNATRYQRMDGNYVSVSKPGLEFFYKISDYDGVRAAFLIDVSQKSPRNFCKAVRHICKQEKGRFDMVIYVGALPFRFYGLFRVPGKYAPKQFNFMAAPLNDGVKKDELLHLDDWDINLSNYDLI